jgi:hypothetical protein
VGRYSIERELGRGTGGRFTLSHPSAPRQTASSETDGSESPILECSASGEERGQGLLGDPDREQRPASISAMADGEHSRPVPPNQPVGSLQTFRNAGVPFQRFPGRP